MLSNLLVTESYQNIFLNDIADGALTFSWKLLYKLLVFVEKIWSAELPRRIFLPWLSCYRDGRRARCVQFVYILRYTDKKETKIFLINKEIQIWSVAKSYIRKGFLIYEEMLIYLVIYEEAVSHIWLCNRSRLNFLIYEKNLIFFFISAQRIEINGIHKQKAAF